MGSPASGYWRRLVPSLVLSFHSHLFQPRSLVAVFVPARSASFMMPPTRSSRGPSCGRSTHCRIDAGGRHGRRAATPASRFRWHRRPVARHVRCCATSCDGVNVERSWPAFPWAKRVRRARGEPQSWRWLAPRRWFLAARAACAAALSYSRFPDAFLAMRLCGVQGIRTGQGRGYARETKCSVQKNRAALRPWLAQPTGKSFLGPLTCKRWQ